MWRPRKPVKPSALGGDWGAPESQPLVIEPFYRVEQADGNLFRNEIGIPSATS